MPMFQFIGAALASVIIASFASIAWPKFTSQPRPEALTQVRNIVIQTEAGRGVAYVLGVTDEKSAEPVSIASYAATGVNSVVNTVTTSVQEAVTAKVIEQLIGKFNQLPKEQQDAFRTQICKPLAK
jgi:hypothetical protein